MKKNITTLLALGLIFSGNIINAQTGRVGINTADPKSTMDISGKKDGSGNLLPTDMTGLQAPRLTRAELTAKGNTLYGTDQKGALIYITDISAGDALSQRINITSEGYYYFDGAFWQKFADTDTNNTPTGFERLPNMTATDFHWRLIGADATKYGTEGKYGLDATWNPANMNETYFPGPYSYNQIMALAGLTISDLGAKGQNSFTAGAINSASGIASTALGTGNTASGVGSFASGVGTKSTGLFTTSMGRSTVANGDGAFSAGLFSEATNNAAVSMGNTSKASGENSVAIGQANTASAQGTLAIGNTNTASAVSAVGIGQQNTASGQGSMALGNTNTTSATSSTAIGQTNAVAGSASVAIGNNNGITSTASSSVGVGFDNQLTAINTFALGEINKLNGTSSYAFGRNNEALAAGTYSAMLGYDNKAENTNSIIVGGQNTAKGSTNLIFGRDNTTNGARSMALGTSNNITGDYSKAIGHTLTAESAFSTTMGLNNTPETSPEATAFSDMTKRLFTIGNGTATTKSDALTILRNGKTGLSQSVPTETLDVGVGNVRVRDINSNTGSLATDKYVVADSNGVLKTVAVPAAPSPVNIYTADGSLTGTSSPSFFRTLNLNGSNLQFTGFQQRTSWSATGALTQSNTQTGTNGLASMVFSGGGSTQLSLQQFNGGDGQVFVSSGSTALNIGSNASTVSTPIRFFTSTGSGALGLERARITGEGNFGIATLAPSETLDVGAGNVRVRQINSNSSTNANDKIVVADSNGVLKTTSIFIPKTAIVGMRTTATSTIAANVDADVVFTNNPLLSGFTYNSSTGVYTAQSAGYYQITGTVRKDISMNGFTSSGTTVLRLRVNGSTVNSVSNAYLDGTSSTNQNMTYVVYLNANDTFNFNTVYTRTSTIINAQVSVIALGG